MEISGSITNQQQPTTNNQAPAATKTIDPNFLIMWKELYTKLDLPRKSHAVTNLYNNYFLRGGFPSTSFTLNYSAFA